MHEVFFFFNSVLSEIKKRYWNFTAFDVFKVWFVLYFIWVKLFIYLLFKFWYNVSIGEDSDKMGFLQWYRIPVFSLFSVCWFSWLDSCWSVAKHYMFYAVGFS